MRFRILALALCLIAQTVARSQPEPGELVPWLLVDEARFEIHWSRGAGEVMQLSATIRQPSLIFAPEDGTAPESPPAEMPAPPAPAEVVREASPFPVDVDQIFIHGATLSFVNRSRPTQPLLEMHGIEMTLENFATTRTASSGLPTLLVVRGKIGREGHVAMYVTLNPWSDGLDFAGRAQVVNLRAEEIASLVEQQADIRPTDGTISVFVEFSVKDGEVSGTVRPFLSDIEVTESDPGVVDELKTWFARGAIELLSADLPSDERIATEIPIRGKITTPNPDVWSAIVGVLGNAFVQAISVGYGGG